MDYILTIDAGTSALKVMLWDETGAERSSCSEELTLLTDDRGYVEFPVEGYWEAASRGIRHVISASGIDPVDIRVAAISSQGETLINLNKDGKPLRNAIVWIDNRSTDEAAAIEREFGREEVFRVSGQPEVVPTWPATKILWQRENEPEVFGDTAKFLMVEDYLLFRLTGKYAAECSVHSSTLWLDINGRRLWGEMLGFLGVEPSNFAEIGDSGQVIGGVCAEACRETGLRESTLVVTGALDQAAGAIGAGNIREGICSETTGSALAACVLAPTPVINPECRIPCHCHAIRDRYYLMAWGQTAGMALKWFKDRFCEQAADRASSQRRSVYEILAEEAKDVPPGSDGLVFLPHLTGAACPEFDPHARGVFYGITLDHGRAHFVRAIMEAVAYMLKLNIALLERMKVAVEEIRSGGGGSRSRLWNQIKADVLEKPVIPVLVTEAASAGAAIIAGAAIGMFSDLAEGCRKMTSLGDRVIPEAANRQTYQRGYQVYTQLYERLAPVFAGDVETRGGIDR